MLNVTWKYINHCLNRFRWAGKKVGVRMTVPKSVIFPSESIVEMTTDTWPACPFTGRGLIVYTVGAAIATCEKNNPATLHRGF
jgi:hypothetical protein